MGETFVQFGGYSFRSQDPYLSPDDAVLTGPGLGPLQSPTLNDVTEGLQGLKCDFSFFWLEALTHPNTIRWSDLKAAFYRQCDPHFKTDHCRQAVVTLHGGGEDRVDRCDYHLEDLVISFESKRAGFSGGQNPMERLARDFGGRLLESRAGFYSNCHGYAFGEPIGLTKNDALMDYVDSDQWNRPRYFLEDLLRKRFRLIAVIPSEEMRLRDRIHPRPSRQGPVLNPSNLAEEIPNINSLFDQKLNALLRSGVMNSSLAANGFYRIVFGFRTVVERETGKSKRERIQEGIHSVHSGKLIYDSESQTWEIRQIPNIMGDVWETPLGTSLVLYYASNLLEKKGVGADGTVQTEMFYRIFEPSIQPGADDALLAQIEKEKRAFAFIKR
ncbi:MAG: hypothetical protein Q7S00_07655 [bacterium]|nr:hypothetical protein [bacterium]